MNNAATIGLKGTALKAATELEQEFPDVEFSSGRRNVREQAHAMASNTFRDRNFVKSTYKKPLCLAAARCQYWSDKNPRATLDQIEVAFERILCSLSDEELSYLSCHLSGEAFDVRRFKDPRRNDSLKVACAALAAKYGGLFLDHEGKLIVFHLQFRGV